MVQFLVIDLFCGAGGTSTGFAMAKEGTAKVIACVNHDPLAIQSHSLNHPETVHFTEDILLLDLTKMVELLAKWKALYPGAKVILWASLECTNFSNAKGGQPRDADSRTLAYGLPRYIEALNPDYLMIENVVEFMAWGELDHNGKPISRKKGIEWVKWKEFINSQYGYRDEWREMNSADYGSFTARNRLFGCFAKEGLPIVFPKPTHSKKASEGMFGGLKLWNSVREKLDFSDEGTSIFNRKKPIVDSTLERIYAGLIKFKDESDELLIKYNSRNQKGHIKPPSLEEPCPTIACQGRLALAFIQKHYSGSPASKVKSLKEPLGVITTIDHHSLVMAENFLLRYNGGEKSLLSIEKPCPTLTTKDRFAKCTVKGFVFNRAYKGSSHSLSNPCPVIIARQDKAPLYLIISESGTFNIPIYDEDSEILVKIKKFMAANEIADIKMRMLKVDELLIIQGFPADYKLVGSKADQTKFIGNSVEPNVVKAWIESMAEQFNQKKHDTNSCLIN